MKHPNRPLLIAANWKMHKTLEESVAFFNSFEKLLRPSSASIYLAVPFTAIKTMADRVGKSGVLIGAQNMHEAEEGAYTGEISGRMLTDAGARFVILGHSERRRYFHETDSLINKKVQRAFLDGLQPILCIGETQTDRDQGLTEAVLKCQLTEGLAAVDQESAKKLVIAYEPVWAIGAHSATPEVIRETHLVVRKILTGLFGEGAERIPILYGGSVNPENAHELIAQQNVDGFLVGTASLSAESFAKIVQMSDNQSFKTNTVTKC